MMTKSDNFALAGSAGINLADFQEPTGIELNLPDLFGWGLKL